MKVHNDNKISCCRICKSESLTTVLDLGTQTLTGVFPKTQNEKISEGPLVLVKCTGKDGCGLLQLANSFPLDEMYGDNYGYRSGLNPSMVAHLKSKIEKIEKTLELNAGDVVIDIGSNDGTSLKQYTTEGLIKVGIDPTAEKFSAYHDDSMKMIPDFFSKEIFEKEFGVGVKAKVISSFSMFYDLEEPLEIVKEIESLLDENGIWVCEQSYMPLMLETNSFDTVCHEHLEYYALEQIIWMANKANLKIVDVELNDVNGGSFSFVAQKESGNMEISPSVLDLIENEKKLKLNTLEPYKSFAENAEISKTNLLSFLKNAKQQGLKVFALVASTKGNVLLQYCNLNSDLIEAVGEVNECKFGSYTPGTLIPIIDELEVFKRDPDICIVLPWHFKNFFNNEERYKNLRLVYPLPILEG